MAKPEDAEGRQLLAQVDLKKTTFFELDIIGIAAITSHKFDQFMAFSIEQLGEIDSVIGQWCVARVPPAIKNQIDHDYEVDGQAVTLLEVRPMWRGQAGEFTRSPFVKLRYVKSVPFGKSTGGVNPASGICTRHTRVQRISRSPWPSLMQTTMHAFSAEAVNTR